MSDRETCSTHHGQLNREVRGKDLLGAFPLLLGCWNLGRLQLPLAEVGHGVDDNPRDTTTEVHELVELSVNVGKYENLCAHLVKKEAH